LSAKGQNWWGKKCECVQKVFGCGIQNINPVFVGHGFIAVPTNFVGAM